MPKRGALLLLAVAAVVLVGVPLPTPASASSPASPATAGVPSLPAMPSFAARAGFSPHDLTLVRDQRPAQGNVSVVVVFSLRASPDATTPRSPGTPPMSVQEFADRFGLAPTSLAEAQTYFESYGLKVTSVSADHLSLSLVGTATEVGRAFGTSLLAGTDGSRPVVFPARPPTLPPTLEREVAGVVGLSSGFDAFTFSLTPAGPSGPSVSPNTITPARARAIYDLSGLYNLTGGPTNATGHDIAVVLWGRGYSPRDLSTFFANYYPSTFPAWNVTPYPVDGAPPPSRTATLYADKLPVEELTLDIEWSASMAPGARIDAVYTQEGSTYPNYSPSAADLTNAFETALGLRSTRNLTAISMSFGSSEGSDASLIAAWNPLIAEAKQLGVTLLGATGDEGGDTTVCSGTPDPQFPASSPDVLAVGGTSVTLSTLFGGGFSETAWSSGGGGYSGVYGAPAWQEVGSAAAPISANGHRGMPDVSATAADDFVYFNGTVGSAAGTSFATPLWAGLVAMIDAKWGHPLGFFTDRLYHEVANQTSSGVGVADVTSGSNCVASAVAGWDAATGWGSPRAAALYAELIGSFVRLSLSVRPSPVAPGGTVTVHVDLSNLSTGQPIAGQEVKLTLSSDVPAGPCSGTFGSATPSTDANGTVVARFTVPFCYLGTHARVDAQVTTVRYFGSASAKVPVNLAGWFPQLAFLTHPPWNYLTFVAIMAVAVALGGWLGRRVGPPPGPFTSYPAAVAPPPPAPPGTAVVPPPPPTGLPAEETAATPGPSSPSPPDEPAGTSPSSGDGIPPTSEVPSSEVNGDDPSGTETAPSTGAEAPTSPRAASERGLPPDSDGTAAESGSGSAGQKS